mgnify:CR=1 FL=1
MWTQLHERRPVSRREVQERTGYGWRKAQLLIEEVRTAQENWVGHERAKHGPMVGHLIEVKSRSYEPERAKDGPEVGQVRAKSDVLQPCLQDTSTITTPSIDRVKRTWDRLMSVSANGKTTSSRLKLTKWRRSMLSRCVGEYSADEVVQAWTWWNESTDENAEFLRRTRGRAGIDTFLRRSNHDKYQAFAEGWKAVMQEPGPDASIEDMRAWLDHKNRKLIQQ